MLLFVYTTTCKRFVIFTCRYFKLSWNTTVLSQSNCRNFSCSSIKGVIIKFNKGNCSTVEPILYGQPNIMDSFTCRHLGRSWRCPLNRGFTVLKYFYYPSSTIINPVLQVVLFCALLILTEYHINENPVEMASDFYISLNFIRLLQVVFSSQQCLNRLAVNAIQWRHYSFALIHWKSKTWFSRFSSGKPRHIAWKCLHDTELLYIFRS